MSAYCGSLSLTLSMSLPSLDQCSRKDLKTPDYDLLWTDLDPQNSDVEVLIPNVTISGHKAFKEVVKVKGAHKSEDLSS